MPATLVGTAARGGLAPRVSERRASSDSRYATVVVAHTQSRFRMSSRHDRDNIRISVRAYVHTCTAIYTHLATHTFPHSGAQRARAGMNKPWGWKLKTINAAGMRQRRGKGLGLYGILIQGSLIETRYTVRREEGRGGTLQRGGRTFSKVATNSCNCVENLRRKLLISNIDE